MIILDGICQIVLNGKLTFQISESSKIDFMKPFELMYEFEPQIDKSENEKPVIVEQDQIQLEI